MTQTSHVMRKTDFGISDKIGLQPSYSATGTSERLEVSDIERVTLLSEK